jgi:CRISPR-associated exonuclease Cas4
MTPEPVVLLSALEHHLYCPRQSALIHVDGLWAENASTVAGTRAHRRVDTAPGRRERGRLVLRGLPLYSERYGLSGRADSVEVHDDGSLGGVRGGWASWPSRRGPVVRTSLLLGGDDRASGPGRGGLVRRPSPAERGRLGSELRTATLAAIDEVRATLISGVLPPAVADERCRECQLEPACMPHVVVRPNAVVRYIEREVFGCG